MTIGGDIDKDPFLGVVQSKGLLWLANANAFPINFQTAGMQIHMRPSEVPFLVEYMTNRGLSQVETLKNAAQSMKMIDDGKWTEKNGDKRSELVFIGNGLKKADGGRERKTRRHEGMEDSQGSILRWHIGNGNI